MRAFIITIVTLVLGLGLMLTAGCPTNPDTEKAIQEKARIPGLQEAVLAKDRAIEAAITMSWASDVELLQEQLAVEEVRAGKVRITGIVSREKLKVRAEAIAEEMEGVVDVVSTITVDESLQENRLSLDDM